MSVVTGKQSPIREPVDYDECEDGQEHASSDPLATIWRARMPTGLIEPHVVKVQLLAAVCNGRLGSNLAGDMAPGS
jgi:hypothetical protein